MADSFCCDYVGYVGTTSTNGSLGVYKIGFDAAAKKLRVLDTRPAYNAGYLGLSLDKKTLYVLSEGMIFRGKASGGITAYNIADGAFDVINFNWTGGQRPCYVSCDDENAEIYVGNFFNGVLSVFERRPDGGVGALKFSQGHKKMNPFFGPGIHCAVKCPTGRYLAALEASGDIVYIYDCENNYRLVGSGTPNAKMCGPRHVLFSADGRYLYVNRQMDEQVSVFRFTPEEEQVLTEIQAVRVREEGLPGRIEPSAIRFCPGTNLIIVSNRGRDQQHADSVTLFEADPETGLLTRLQVVETEGQLPRDVNFTPDGRFLIVGYQQQNYLDIFELNLQTKQLEYVGKGPEIPSPVCIAF